MNRKILAVIKREYVTRARTKAFIIGTLITPVMLILVFGGIFIFNALLKPSTQRFTLVDLTGQLATEFIAQLQDTLRDGSPKYQFTVQSPMAGEVETALQLIQKKVLAREIQGYLIVPENIVDQPVLRYSARNVSDIENQESFSRAMSRVVTNRRLEKIGLSPETIRREMDLGRVRLESHQVTDTGEVQKNAGASFGLAYLLAYILLLLIMVYGQMVMRSVIEEKTQRITEMIVSSIRPVELLAGKLMGICMLGVTQLVVIGLILMALVFYAEPLLLRFGINSEELLSIISSIDFSPTIFAFLIFYFFMGFLFYAGMFGAIGAMINTEDEGQQFQMPLVFIIIIGYFVVFGIAQNPDTPAAFWISMIPFYTPLIMFARIAVSDPVLPSGAILSIFTMLGFTTLLIWLTARIYRVGILMYGKKPSIKEAWKWLKVK